VDVLRVGEPADHLELLYRTLGEIRALFDGVLIGIEGFFRDPEAFSAPRSRFRGFWICFRYRTVEGGLARVCTGLRQRAPGRIGQSKILRHLRVEQTFPHVVYKVMVLNARKIPPTGARSALLLPVNEDESGETA
jgi:hypothetical protein